MGVKFCGGEVKLPTFSNILARKCDYCKHLYNYGNCVTHFYKKCDYLKAIEQLKSNIYSQPELRDKILNEIKIIEKERDIIDFFFYIIGSYDSYDPYILNDFNQQRIIKIIYKELEYIKLDKWLWQLSGIRAIQELIATLRNSLCDIVFNVPEFLENILTNDGIDLQVLREKSRSWESNAQKAQRRGLIDVEVTPIEFKNWPTKSLHRRNIVYTPY